MLKNNALGCKALFLIEERTESYLQYGEESAVNENKVLRPKFPRRIQLRWMAGGNGAGF